MSVMPTYEEAVNLLRQYNQEPFHITHALTVAGVMKYFAGIHDPQNEKFWEIAGLLHDLDFEHFPQEHCQRSQQIMRGLDYDEKLIRATASHGFGICSDIEPADFMEKILYATDELTGLIGAVAKMRPSGSVMDLPVKSVLKKFKTPSFAAGCSREIISSGARMLGWELTELIEKTIDAMRSLENQDSGSET
jgi:predicted hydrolase (HD superfamily)